ncbi:glycosyltransferase family 4 protein [Methylophilus glucosoxydans]|uniref:Glycosyltransferase family 4 protein n=1 Tax=Methylophilus glucosoxydans TaxID=752553 RepID=A0ABW3GJ40_9PROT
MTDVLVIQSAREVKPGGGVSGVAFELGENLKSSNVEIGSFTIDDIYPNSFKNSSNLFLKKIAQLFDIIVYGVWGSLKLKRLYKSNNQAVVLCHNDGLYGDIYINHGLHRAMLFASDHPYRMLLRNPLHLYLLVREWVRFKLNIHKHIVCFSANDASIMEKTYPNTLGRITIIPNGVHINKFMPNSMVRKEKRLELGYLESDFVLIFVGHEFDRKGLKFLVNSLLNLPENVKLLVVGGGSAEKIEEYKNYCKDNGLTHRVSFLGTRKDIPDLLNASDCFVMPSAFEAWPLVGLEAMACAKPALITDTGGVSAFVKPGYNGYLIKRDADDIAEKIRSLMSDEASYIQICKQARETAESYSWQNIADKYLSLIKQCLVEKNNA